jgi:hypothetical protein
MIVRLKTIILPRQARDKRRESTQKASAALSYSNFELGTRVPIIIRDPSKKGGIVSNLLVESVDL